MDFILFGNLNVTINFKGIKKIFKPFKKLKKIFVKKEINTNVSILHSDIQELENLYIENTKYTDYMILNYDGEIVFHEGMNSLKPESEFNLFIKNLKIHIIKNNTKNYKFVTLQKSRIYCIYTLNIKNVNGDPIFYIIINKPINIKDLNIDSLIN